MSDQQDRKLQHTDDQMPGVGAEIWKPGEPASAAETGEPGQPAQESSVGIRETRSREEKAGLVSGHRLPSSRLRERTSKWTLISKPPAKCWRLICNAGEESSDLNLLNCRSVSVWIPCA